MEAMMLQKLIKYQVISASRTACTIISNTILEMNPLIALNITNEPNTAKLSLVELINKSMIRIRKVQGKVDDDGEGDSLFDKFEELIATSYSLFDVDEVAKLSAAIIDLNRAIDSYETKIEEFRKVKREDDGMETMTLNSATPSMTLPKSFKLITNATTKRGIHFHFLVHNDSNHSNFYQILNIK